VHSVTKKEGRKESETESGIKNEYEDEEFYKEDFE
jgi:hypothetical protein